MQKNLCAAVLFWLLPGIAGCSSLAPSQDDVERGEIEQMMAAQAKAWNRGDLRAFVDWYWQSPKMTFCGGNGITRGAADLLAKYRRGYPDAASRGTLTFELAEVRQLGGGAAMVLGRYHLARAEDDHGWFTLLVERVDGSRLRITHDHTTSTVVAKGGSSRASKR